MMNVDTDQDKSYQYPNVLLDGRHVLWLTVRDDHAGEGEMTKVPVNHVEVTEGELRVEVDTGQES